MIQFPEALRTGSVLRIELAVIGTVHLMLGAVIAWAPTEIIVTAGSMPVFRILPTVLDVGEARAAWAVAYAVCGFLVLALAFQLRSIVLMHLAWGAVGFTNGIWSLVFIIAALKGLGSALGAVIFLVPLLWSGFAGIRVAQGTGGTSVEPRSGRAAGNPR